MQGAFIGGGGSKVVEVEGKFRCHDPDVGLFNEYRRATAAVSPL